MSILATESTPFSKAVFPFFSTTFSLKAPKTVLFPTLTIQTSPLPDTTLDPSKAKEETSKGLAFAKFPLYELVFFSTGCCSPVKADCETNKSLAATTLTSAGSISPAPILTISPTTN